MLLNKEVILNNNNTNNNRAYAFLSLPPSRSLASIQTPFAAVSPVAESALSLSLSPNSTLNNTLNKVNNNNGILNNSNKEYVVFALSPSPTPFLRARAS